MVRLFFLIFRKNSTPACMLLPLLPRLYKRIVRLFFFLLVCTSMFTQGRAQQETSNWYFGYGAGLDFSKGSPVFQEGRINQWEGCASISDRKGRLLFYTNGQAVWNREHKTMRNGKGLKGHNSSTQSSIIIPQPGGSRLYYIFTVTSEGGAAGLQYSVVDMQAGEGLGDIVEKNIPLLTPVCEKLTAVRHADGKHIWVITRKYKGDEYYAYLVTADGVTEQPVISKTGNIVSGRLNAIGYLKVSPDGTKLAAAHMTSFTEVGDFDPATGQVSNLIKLEGDTRAYAYGVEFSKNAEFLYTTEMAQTNGRGPYAIFQYEVSGNADSLMASKQLIASGDVGGAAGALQLGPDNKLYIAFNQQPFLGCIQYPERRGEACAFKEECVSLATTKSGLGLPTFIQSYLQDAGARAGYLLYAISVILLLLLLLFLWYRRKKRKTETIRPKTSG